MKWIAFFSKTGSELIEIMNHFNRWPDLIVSNRPHLDGCHEQFKSLIQSFPDKVRHISSSPTVEEYKRAIESTGTEDVIITLHGYMRILPKEICDTYDIYNGHPGLITKYPELKGKDPQRKAWLNGYAESGCVIHKVTSELDGGPVMAQVAVDIKDLSFDNVISELHKASVKLWIEFMKKQWIRREYRELTTPKTVLEANMAANIPTDYRELVPDYSVEYCQEHYPETLKELRRLQEEEFLLFCKKQFDYGPGNISVGQDTAAADGKRVSLCSIIFRCNDKVQRLLNLVVKNSKCAQNEPVMDAFSDLSLYGKIAKIVDKGVWGK